MKKNKLLLAIIISLIVSACSNSKKVRKTNSVASSPVVATPATPSFSATKSNDGIYPPGQEELSAINIKYPDASLAKLQEGYLIYTQGACIQCHGTVSIYSHDEEQWKNIIDDMAQRAKISDLEKDAVYKYVFSIKSTQGK
ncbi:MAG: cytochrome c [Bacteroidetes bacterium]|nr:cytochrome c [Bacteroidota bacterium]